MRKTKQRILMLFVLPFFLTFEAFGQLGKSPSEMVQHYGTPTAEQRGYMRYWTFPANKRMTVQAMFLNKRCIWIKYMASKHKFGNREVDEILRDNSYYGLWYRLDKKGSVVTWADRSYKQAFANVTPNAIEISTAFAKAKIRQLERKLDSDVQRASQGQKVNEIAQRVYEERERIKETSARSRRIAAEEQQARALEKQAEEAMRQRHEMQRQTIELMQQRWDRENTW